MFSGSLVAIVTPMHSDGGIDWPAWERLLAWQLEGGTTGIVVGGTTGEAATISEAELLQLLAHARPRLKGRAALIAGAGSSGTAATVERVRRLCAAGVDGLLIMTPAYNKPTQEGLYRHFEAVAAASEAPILLYNVPTRTAVDLLPQTVARLARLPRIAAIKEAVAGAERVREVLAATDGAFTVLSGDDATCAAAMLNGARGVISVTANVMPRAMSQLCAAALRADRAATVRIDASLAALHEVLFVEPNPIPIKWVLAELGLIGPGIRLPLTPLSVEYQARVRAEFEQALRWESIPADPVQPTDGSEHTAGTWQAEQAHHRQPLSQAKLG